jgi:hypothetical protein
MLDGRIVTDTGMPVSVVQPSIQDREGSDT